jgi:hypothetical protein
MQLMAKNTSRKFAALQAAYDEAELDVDLKPAQEAGKSRDVEITFMDEHEDTSPTQTIQHNTESTLQPLQPIT